MAIRLFVLDQDGELLPGARVHCFIRFEAGKPIDLVASYTDRNGYAKLEMRLAPPVSAAPGLAALPSASDGARALVVEVEGCPESARVLLEFTPEQDPLPTAFAALSASTISGDFGALLG